MTYTREEYRQQLRDAFECVIDVMVEGEHTYKKDSWRIGNPNSFESLYWTHLKHALAHVNGAMGELQSYEISKPQTIEEVSHAATRCLMTLQLIIENK